MRKIRPIGAFIKHASFCFKRAKLGSWPSLTVVLLCLLAVKLKAVRGGRLVLRVEFQDLCLHVNGFSGELCSYWEIYLDRQYGADLPRRDDLCIVDAGANIGIFSLQQLRQHPSGLTLLAIEPDPEVFQRLAEHVAPFLRGQSRVHLLNVALGASTGIARFIRESSTSSHVANSAEDDCAAIDVRMEALDNIVEGYELRRIDLLKIDVEGFEMQVLQGGLEAALAITQEIVLEYHNGDGADVVELLGNHGFRVAWRNEQKCILAFARCQAVTTNDESLA